MFNHILLCTHGTDGAKKAESLVFDQLARQGQVKVTVLTVLDEDWRLMTGDDWLNSSKTHTVFLDHVEEQVSEEISEEWQRIKKSFAIGDVTFVQRTGEIAETITATAKQLGCDLIVIGPYRKTKLLTLHMEKGLRARMKNEVLHPLLPCPLLIAP
ncbi:MAG: universal stress protein [Thermodesulfobacteriota bacterium]